MHLPEISDLIVDHDPARGRRPVHKQAVIDRFIACGDRWAARIVSRLPAHEGVLDERAVDDLLIAAHRELQRLNEEFQQGPRLLALLRAMLALAPPGARVVDVGCGNGYMSRWLAAHGALDAELVGCDFNPALIAEARSAAQSEALNVRFEEQDAFCLSEPGHIFTSTGVIHHFSEDGLRAMFRQHGGDATVGFIHYDIESSWVTPIGAALFHIARMRLPLAQHDGIWSARRAHPAHVLIAAAKEALPDFEIGIFDKHRGLFPVTKVLRPIVGVRRPLAEAFREALGPRAKRWVT